MRGRPWTGWTRSSRPGSWWRSWTWRGGAPHSPGTWPDHLIFINYLYKLLFYFIILYHYPDRWDVLVLSLEAHHLDIWDREKITFYLDANKCWVIPSPKTCSSMILSISRLNGNYFKVGIWTGIAWGFKPGTWFTCFDVDLAVVAIEGS